MTKELQIGSRSERLGLCPQNYLFTDPDAPTTCYIGTDRIDANRAGLEQVVQATKDKLVPTPASVIADQKTALTKRRKDYVGVNTTKSGAQSDSMTASPAALETMFKRTVQRRIIIQFVADAEWPWHDPASADIRKKFQHPPGGPLTG